MKDERIHRAYRPKGAIPLGGGERTAGDALPPSLPPDVLRALEGMGSGPLFLYRPGEVRRRSREVAAAFPGFFFPAKCNPHPEVLRAALAGGAGLSLRSFGELDLALRLGAPPARLSFTGWGLGPTLMKRLIRLGVAVNLDSAREVAQWVAHFPGEPFGVRLMAGDDPEYLSTGFAREEVGPMIEGARRARARLVGVLVHWPHRVAGAGEMAEEFAPLPGLLQNTLGSALGGLSYLNLGGGWPAPYAGGEAIPAAEVARALDRGLLRSLRAAGFRGRLVVEPGRAVAASCGWWAARVAGVEGTIARLHAPPPAPPLRLPYPAHLVREGAEVRAPGPSKGLTSYRLLGLASPPIELIREGVPLPPVRKGDILVFSQAGAYLGTGLLGEGWKGEVGAGILGG